MKKYKEIEEYLKKSIAKNIAPDFDPCLDEDIDAFLNTAKARIELSESYIRVSNTTIQIMRRLLLLYLLKHLDEIYAAKDEKDNSLLNKESKSSLANAIKLAEQYNSPLTTITKYSTQNDQSIGYFKLTNIIKSYAVELGKSSLPKDLVCDFLMELIENYPIQLCESEFSYDIFDIFEKGRFFFRNVDVLEFSTGNIDIYLNLLFVSLKSVISREKINPTLRPIKIKNNINQIKKSYLHNQENFDETSIEEVCWSLERLGFPHNLITYMRKTLKKELFENQMSKKAAIEAKKSKNLTDKEYRAVLKEIRKSYNPYTRELLEEISEEKREYITYLMVKVEIDQSVISDFLSKTEVVEKTYTYDYFKDHVEEFKFYFGEELDQIFEYMEEIKLCVSSEDKEYWIMGINEELDKLKSGNKLNSYEYETKLLVERRLEENE